MGSIHEVVDRGDFQVLCELVEKERTLIAALDGIRSTPLHYFYKNHVDQSKIISYLIKKGAKVNARNKYASTPLHMATAFEGTFASIKILVENGADLEAKTIDGHRALHYAAGTGKLEIVKYLVQQGAVLNAKDLNSETPLEEAVKFSHVKVKHFLEDLQ